MASADPSSEKNIKAPPSIEKLQNDINRLEKSERAFLCQIQLQKQQLAEAQTQISKLEEGKEQDDDGYRRELRSLNEQVEEMNQKVRDYDEAKQREELLLAELIEANHCKEQVAGLEEEMSRWKVQAEELAAELEKFQQHHDDTLQEIQECHESIVKEKDDLIQQLEQSVAKAPISEEVAWVESTNVHLKSQLLEVEATADARFARIQALEQEVKKLIEENLSLRNEHSFFLARLAEEQLKSIAAAPAPVREHFTPPVEKLTPLTSPRERPTPTVTATSDGQRFQQPDDIPKDTWDPKQTESNHDTLMDTWDNLGASPSQRHLHLREENLVEASSRQEVPLFASAPVASQDAPSCPTVEVPKLSSSMNHLQETSNWIFDAPSHTNGDKMQGRTPLRSPQMAPRLPGLPDVEQPMSPTFQKSYEIGVRHHQQRMMQQHEEEEMRHKQSQQQLQEQQQHQQQQQLPPQQQQQQPNPQHPQQKQHQHPYPVPQQPHPQHPHPQHQHPQHPHPQHPHPIHLQQSGQPNAIQQMQRPQVQGAKGLQQMQLQPQPIQQQHLQPPPGQVMAATPQHPCAAPAGRSVTPFRGMAPLPDQQMPAARHQGQQPPTPQPIAYKAPQPLPNTMHTQPQQMIPKQPQPQLFQTTQPPKIQQAQFAQPHQHDDLSRSITQQWSFEHQSSLWGQRSSTPPSARPVSIG
eukprot:TRINITY_DN23024_c0_g1_i1.p1 TRINITY_DN23024_c0_g1~~TRINITY_DN23024_c0_g1_i1.p1  ORF type:complete len:693 (-),score=141.71 TRINITY_DN23024_c0_g1_i1:43-2121(-)